MKSQNQEKGTIEIDICHWKLLGLEKNSIQSLITLIATEFLFLVKSN